VQEKMDQKLVDKQYLDDLEALVKARTEQLREAVIVIDELVGALKPFRPELAQKAMESLQRGLTTKDV
jgi:hypothetical protein